MRRWLATTVALAGCGLGVVGIDPDGVVSSTADASISADVVAPPPIGMEDGGLDADDADGVDANHPPIADGGADVEAAAPRVLSFVQSAPGSSANATSYTFTINPTKPGNFIALVVSEDDGANTHVTGITDNATGGTNVYSAAADAHSVATGCQGTEIWYARATRSATMFTVTLSQKNPLQAWILEVAGLLPTGDAFKSISAIGDGTATKALVLDVTDPPALFVAGVSSCQNIGAALGQNPMQSLGVKAGNTAAYFLANAAGAWSASWGNENTNWNVSVAEFH